MWVESSSIGEIKTVFAYTVPDQVRKQGLFYILIIRRIIIKEPKAGLEPATYSLRMSCSTN